MKQYAVIGLGSLGKHMAEELSRYNVEVYVLDHDEQLIQELKDMVKTAFVGDARDEKVVQRIIPSECDAVIIDLGEKLEASILVCNAVKKLGIERILVKAEEENHAEVLKMVGATEVIFPNKEAAKQLAPALMSPTMLRYLPISDSLVLGEIELPEKMASKSISQSEFQRRTGLQVIAYRSEKDEDQFFSAQTRRTYKLGEKLLVAGTKENLAKYTSLEDEKLEASANIKALFSLFSRKN